MGDDFAAEDAEYLLNQALDALEEGRYAAAQTYADKAARRLACLIADLARLRPTSPGAK